VDTSPALIFIWGAHHEQIAQAKDKSHPWSQFHIIHYSHLIARCQSLSIVICNEQDIPSSALKKEDLVHQNISHSFSQIALATSLSSVRSLKLHSLPPFALGGNGHKKVASPAT
jgi:hypothetical protein